MKKHIDDIMYRISAHAVVNGQIKLVQFGDLVPHGDCLSVAEQFADRYDIDVNRVDIDAVGDVRIAPNSISDSRDLSNVTLYWYGDGGDGYLRWHSRVASDVDTTNGTLHAAIASVYPYGEKGRGNVRMYIEVDGLMHGVISSSTVGTRSGSVDISILPGVAINHGIIVR
jgi:hypothetical protein